MPNEGAQPPSESEISARLVARIANGDAAAEREMYVRYARAVILILKRRGATQDEAEDICQDTFITAYLKLRPVTDGEDASGIRKSESLASFLQGIAINKLLGGRRTALRQDTWADTDAIDLAMAEIETPFEGVAAEQLCRTVKLALDKLAVERDRDILVSVYLRDEDRSSIQQRLAIEPDHFNRVLYRAKQRLAAEVEQLLATGRAKVTELREFIAERHQ